MAKQFDTSLNQLIDLRPEEWAGFFAARAGVPPGPVEVLDTCPAPSRPTSCSG